MKGESVVRGMAVFLCVSIAVAVLLLPVSAEIIGIGYGIWANSTSTTQTIHLSGSKNVVNGNVHSNGEFKMSGSHNNINGTIEYVTSLDISGGNNKYLNALKVSPKKFLVFNINDYKPDGIKAEFAGSHYHYIEGDLHISGTEELSGLYYVTGYAKISGHVRGKFTIVAEGDIHISGSGCNCSAFSEGLLFFSAGNLKISGSKNEFNGIIYAPNGEIDVSGSNNMIKGCLLGDTVKLTGSETYIETDSDGDGIPDAEEIQLGTDPQHWTNTDGVIFTENSANVSVTPNGSTVRISLKVVSNVSIERSPVDVMLVIDRSWSMRQSGWMLIKNGTPAFLFNLTVPKGAWSELKEFKVPKGVKKLAAQVTWSGVEGYEGSEASEVVINLRRPDGTWVFSYPSEAGGSVDPPDSVGRSNEYFSGICTKPQTLLVEHPEEGTWAVAVYGWNLRPKGNPPSSVNATVSIYLDFESNPNDDLNRTETTISIDAAKEAAKTFIEKFNENDRIGFVKFGSYAVLAHGLTNMDEAGKASLKKAIDDIGLQGGTAIHTGINEAREELLRNGREGVPKVIVLLTDGQNDYGNEEVLKSAKAAKDANITIFTVGLTAFVNEEMLKEVATCPDYYYKSPTGAQLNEIYEEISEEVRKLARDIVVKYVLSDGVEYAGNASEPPDTQGNVLEWRVGDMEPKTPWVVEFDVRVWRRGNISLNVVPASNVSYTYGGKLGSVPFPEFHARVLNRAPVIERIGWSSYTTCIYHNDTEKRYVFVANESEGLNERGTVVKLAIAARDPDCDPLSYSKDSNIGTLETNDFYWSPGYDFVRHPERRKNVTITFTVSDGELSDNATVTIIVNDVNRPPKLAPIGSKNVNEGETLTIVLNATDPDEEDALRFSSNVSFGAFISDENTTFWRWTPDYDDAGVYYVEFTVSDGELYDNKTAKIVVNNVNRPPILERIGDITVMENETVLIDVNATDPDGDSLIYSCNRTDLFEFNSTTGEGVWKTDYNDAGIYYIDLGVSDGALCDNETVKITVINVNRAPVLEQIGEKTIYENQTIFIELKANDPDGDALTFSCNRTDLFADFNKTIGKGSWTPGYDDAGIYYVDFGVSDGELCDNETVKITVINVNRPPELLSIENIEINEGKTVAINIDAVDPDGDNLTYSCNRTDLFTDFNLSTGIGHWTPGYDDAGIYYVDFGVSDGMGGIDNETVRITVKDVPYPPVAMFSVSNETPTTNQTVIFDASASYDPDGEIVAYRWDFDGDGIWDIEGNVVKVTHNYNKSGIYNVILEVEDDDGAKNRTTKEINVSSEYLFSVQKRVGKIVKELNNGSISTIREEFENNNISLSENASVTKKGEDEWVIKDGEGASEKEFIVKRERGKLSIYLNGAMIWISGNVTWNGKHTFKGIKNATTIGSPLTITATAYEIKNELNESVNVTAELHVDGVCLNKNTTKIKGNESKGTVSVSATWIPVSSGVHFISLHVYDGPHWVGPTNDPTAKVEVFIEKVEQ